MCVQDQSERAEPPTTERLGCGPAQALAPDEHLTARIEAAILPIRARLGPGQLEVIRAIVRTSVETDPVSQMLMQNAIRAPIALTHRDPETLANTARVGARQQVEAATPKEEKQPGSQLTRGDKP